MSQESSSETQVREEVASPEVEVATNNLPAPSSKEVGKVQLDIEDAPFLKEEPEQSKDSQSKKGEDELDQDGAAKKKKKKKLIIIAAAAVVLVVAIGVVAYLFLSAPTTPPPPPPEEPKPNIVVVPSTPKVAVKPDIIRDFDLFIVPVGTSSQNTKFLVCKFSTVSKNPAINTEIDHKMLVLRDAVYFYLRGKSPEFLLDSSNAAEIKQDLVDILNDYLQRGKLDDVLLDNYLAY